ncbi:MAG: creatininase family protein [Rhodomicrobium sp.]
MTWVEVRTALREGYKTVLVPTGGIEQNGAHMILGKHDYIVGWAANRIALGAGHTLVAPVVSYVPEGGYNPPEGNMQFPGTLGVPDSAFAAVLEGIARSLKTHGFTLICFMGDHGESQRVQSEVAATLSSEWLKEGVRVASLDAYYNDSEQVRRLVGEGETPSTMGQHATSWPRADRDACGGCDRTDQVPERSRHFRPLILAAKFAGCISVLCGRHSSPQILSSGTFPHARP